MSISRVGDVANKRQRSRRGLDGDGDEDGGAALVEGHRGSATALPQLCVAGERVLTADSSRPTSSRRTRVGGGGGSLAGLQKLPSSMRDSATSHLQGDETAVKLSDGAEEGTHPPPRPSTLKAPATVGPPPAESATSRPTRLLRSRGDPPPPVSKIAPCIPASSRAEGAMYSSQLLSTPRPRHTRAEPTPTSTNGGTRQEMRKLKKSMGPSARCLLQRTCRGVTSTLYEDGHVAEWKANSASPPSIPGNVATSSSVPPPTQEPPRSHDLLPLSLPCAALPPALAPLPPNQEDGERTKSGTHVRALPLAGPGRETICGGGGSGGGDGLLTQRGSTRQLHVARTTLAAPGEAIQAEPTPLLRLPKTTNSSAAAPLSDEDGIATFLTSVVNTRRDGTESVASTTTSPRRYSGSGSGPDSDGADDIDGCDGNDPYPSDPVELWRYLDAKAEEEANNARRATKANAPSLISIALPALGGAQDGAEGGDGLAHLLLDDPDKLPCGCGSYELILRLLDRESDAVRTRLTSLDVTRFLQGTPQAGQFAVLFFWFVVVRCRRVFAEKLLIARYDKLLAAYQELFPRGGKQELLPPPKDTEALVTELRHCRIVYDRLQHRERTQPPASLPSTTAAGSDAAVSASVTTAAAAAATASTALTATSLCGSATTSVKDFVLSENNLFGWYECVLRYLPSLVAIGSGTLPRPEELDSFAHFCALFRSIRAEYAELVRYEEAIYADLARLFGEAFWDFGGRQDEPPRRGDKRRTDDTGKAGNRVNAGGGGGETVPTTAATATAATQHLAGAVATTSAEVGGGGEPANTNRAREGSSKDIVLESFATVTVHLTYYTLLYCFPNDVYAGYFHAAFRADLLRLLQYWFSGIILTHVPVRGWPVPIPADYGAHAKPSPSAVVGGEAAPSSSSSPSPPPLAVLAGSPTDPPRDTFHPSRLVNRKPQQSRTNGTDQETSLRCPPPPASGHRPSVTEVRDDASPREEQEQHLHFPKTSTDNGSSRADGATASLETAAATADDAVGRADRDGYLQRVNTTAAKKKTKRTKPLITADDGDGEAVVMDRLDNMDASVANGECRLISEFYRYTEHATTLLGELRRRTNRQHRRQLRKLEKRSGPSFHRAAGGGNGARRSSVAPEGPRQQQQQPTTGEDPASPVAAQRRARLDILGKTMPPSGTEKGEAAAAAPSTSRHRVSFIIDDFLYQPGDFADACPDDVATMPSSACGDHTSSQPFDCNKGSETMAAPLDLPQEEEGRTAAVPPTPGSSSTATAAFPLPPPSPRTSPADSFLAANLSSSSSLPTAVAVDSGCGVPPLLFGFPSAPQPPTGAEEEEGARRSSVNGWSVSSFAPPQQKQQQQQQQEQQQPPAMPTSPNTQQGHPLSILPPTAPTPLQEQSKALPMPSHLRTVPLTISVTAVATPTKQRAPPTKATFSAALSFSSIGEDSQTDSEYASPSIASTCNDSWTSVRRGNQQQQQRRQRRQRERRLAAQKARVEEARERVFASTRSAEAQQEKMSEAFTWSSTAPPSSAAAPANKNGGGVVATSHSSVVPHVTSLVDMAESLKAERGRSKRPKEESASSGNAPPAAQCRPSSASSPSSLLTSYPLATCEPDAREYLCQAASVRVPLVPIPVTHMAAQAMADLMEEHRRQAAKAARTLQLRRQMSCSAMMMASRTFTGTKKQQHLHAPPPHVSTTMASPWPSFRAARDQTSHPAAATTFPHKATFLDTPLPARSCGSAQSLRSGSHWGDTADTAVLAASPLAKSKMQGREGTTTTATGCGAVSFPQNPLSNPHGRTTTERSKKATSSKVATAAGQPTTPADTAVAEADLRRRRHRAAHLADRKALDNEVQRMKLPNVSPFLAQYAATALGLDLARGQPSPSSRRRPSMGSMGSSSSCAGGLGSTRSLVCAGSTGSTAADRGGSATAARATRGLGRRADTDTRVTVLPRQCGLRRPLLYGPLKREALSREEAIREEMRQIDAADASSRNQYVAEHLEHMSRIAHAQSDTATQRYKRKAKQRLELNNTLL